MVCGDNGAMLTKYLFKYTPECTISKSDFQNFLRLGRQGALTPLTKIQRTLVRFTSTDMFMLAPLYHYFAPSMGAIYCDQCQCILYVCLSARLSQKLHCVCCPLKANVMYSKYFPPGTD